MSAPNNLYGVGGELYTFIHQARNDYNKRGFIGMAHRAQELLEAITENERKAMTDTKDFSPDRLELKRELVNKWTAYHHGWRKEPPTVDGIYWWRLSENDPDPDICETDLEMGFVYDIGDPMGVKISERGGEWLGPIVPATSEARDISPLGYEHAITVGWKEHNARRHKLIEAKRSRLLSESEITELAELQWLAGIKRELQTGSNASTMNEGRDGSSETVGRVYGENL